MGENPILTRNWSKFNENLVQTDKSEINYLMLTALKKLAFMPFGYMIDKYRWKLFAGEKNLQKLWDEMRLEYQVLIGSRGVTNIV